MVKKTHKTATKSNIKRSIKILCLSKSFINWTQVVADAADRIDFVHQLQKNFNPSALFNTKN